MTKKKSQRKGQKEGQKKEERNRGAEAASKRWGLITRAELDERVKQIEAVVAALKQSASATEIFGFAEDEEFRVDSATQWRRGIELLENSIEQVQVGIVLHKREKARGDRWHRE